MAHFLMWKQMDLTVTNLILTHHINIIPAVINAASQNQKNIYKNDP